MAALRCGDVTKASFGLIVGFTLVLGASVGCGGGKSYQEFDISGMATVDGTPIPQGSIQFIATDGATPTGGGVIQDGRYSAKVPPGEKTVLIYGSKVVGQAPESPDMEGSPMVDKLETVTPAAYNAQHMSPLFAQISESKSDLNFDLDSKIRGAGADPSYNR